MTTDSGRVPGLSLAKILSWLKAIFSSWMNIRSIITISAEGPSLCSGSNIENHQFKINSGQRRQQEGIWWECWCINLLLTLQRAGGDIYLAWPGSFSADGRRPSQIHHPLCTREPRCSWRLLNLEKGTKLYMSYTRGHGVWYLFDNLEKSWQFPGRDGKAAVCAVCPQKSGKEHCSLGEARNPAVSLVVPASCSTVCLKNTITKNGIMTKLK